MTLCRMRSSVPSASLRGSSGSRPTRSSMQQISMRPDRRSGALSAATSTCSPVATRTACKPTCARAAPTLAGSRSARPAEPTDADDRPDIGTAPEDRPPRGSCPRAQWPGATTQPNSLSVGTRTSSRQTVTVGWSTTCARGFSARGGRDTPACGLRSLEGSGSRSAVPGPLACIVVAESQLTGAPRSYCNSPRLKT